MMFLQSFFFTKIELMSQIIAMTTPYKLPSQLVQWSYSSL